MARRNPLKLVQGTGTTAFEPMQQADWAYTRFLIRNYYANNEMAGWLRINSAPGGWSSRGAFTDSRRSVGGVQIDVSGKNSPNDGNPDAEPGYDINTLTIPITNTTFTVYQNYNGNGDTASTAIQNASAFVKSDTAENALTMESWTTQEIYDTVIDDAIQDIENGGNGRFYIGSVTPAGYTETGTSNVTDTIQSSTTIGGDTVTTVTTYRLSRRTDETYGGAVVRPLINEGGNNGTSPFYREMTDTELLDFFLPYFRNRINEGNRLVYTFSTATGGIDCGSVTDTRYDGSTASTATKVYTRVISGGTSVITTFYLRLADT
jgi:hypothetical protein